MAETKQANTGFVLQGAYGEERPEYLHADNFLVHQILLYSIYVFTSQELFLKFYVAL